MPIDKGAVRVCTLVDDEHGFTASYMRSFLPTLALDLGRDQRLWRGGYAFQQCTSAGVVEGRNEATKAFLESSAEWLWFVDADMGWEPEALEQLLAVADPQERPIVGGLCFGYSAISDRIDHAQAVVKKPFPTIFDLVDGEDDVAFRPRWRYTPGSVLQCSATGAAMLLIHRTVIEAMAEHWPGGWFDRVKHPKAKKLWGEDTSFCYKAGGLGFPTFVHTGVKTSHAKVIFVTENTFLAEIMQDPATDPIAVVVPVLNRPQNAEPFMRSLRASTGLARVYAICSHDDPDSVEAWSAVGADVIVQDTSRHGTFPEKVNDAFSKTVEPWLFLVGDDVRFHPGWLDHAQQTARVTGAKVVGTNDLGNERVMAGEHATHMLIARDYIETQGASWDGPGIVCHEGYRHWCVDDELVTVAKQNGVWAPSLGSIVEHLHPYWGKGEKDDTYRKGEFNATRDQGLFKVRLSQHKVAA